MRTRLSLLLVVAALLAFAAACDDAGDGDAAQDVALIELRVWQSVGDPGELHATPRLPGSDWDAIGTGALAKDGRSAGFADAAVHHYSDLAVAGVGLRIWQRAVEPERIFVQACASTCPERFPIEVFEVLVLWPWHPLGMTPLSLDDGSSPSGRYRYGDITIAVPRGNPGLLADREHLLALRDVIEGGDAQLDWKVATPTASWEGVMLSGSPPRVTRLDLSGRGLTGQIWGYLGDLAELTELRLDGNRLTGLIPSKLVLLSKLTHVSLGGNPLEGCVASPLRSVRDNDLDKLDLPDCAEPAIGQPDQALRAGTYRLGMGRRSLVLDVPTAEAVRIEHHGPRIELSDTFAPSRNIFETGIAGLAVRRSDDPETWLFIDPTTGDELERSPYAGCVYDCGPVGSPSALLEQLAASVWLNAVGEDGEWVWP